MLLQIFQLREIQAELPIHKFVVGLRKQITETLEFLPVFRVDLTKFDFLKMRFKKLKKNQLKNQLKNS